MNTKQIMKKIKNELHKEGIAVDKSDMADINRALQSKIGAEKLVGRFLNGRISPAKFLEELGFVVDDEEESEERQSPYAGGQPPRSRRDRQAPRNSRSKAAQQSKPETFSSPPDEEKSNVSGFFNFVKNLFGGLFEKVVVLGALFFKAPSKTRKWILIGLGILVLTIVGVFTVPKFLGNGGDEFVLSTPQGTPQGTETPQPTPPTTDTGGDGDKNAGINLPQKQIRLDLIVTGLLAINIIGLLEAWTRWERWWLDWWIAPVTVVVVGLHDHMPQIPWIVVATIDGVLLFFAIFINESEEDEYGWQSVDTTTLASTAGQMILVQQIMNSYPQLIPTWVLWIIFVLGMVKELFRTPALGILACVAGLVAAFTLDPWVMSGMIMFTVILVTVLANVDWIPQRNRHQVNHPLNMGDRQVSLVVPWDVLLAQVFVFVFVSLQLYGNFLLLDFIAG